MSTWPRRILGMALVCLLAMSPDPATADEETEAVMARHPLYPVVAGILYLQTGKDIDSLSKQEVADAVAAVITGYPELEPAVTAAIVHGAMVLRADASTEILDTATAAQMSLSEDESTMPMSNLQSSEGEEMEAPPGPKRTGNIVPAIIRTAQAVGTRIAEEKAARAESTKGYHPSERSEVFEQAYAKLVSRYSGWASLGTVAAAVRQAAATGADMDAAIARANAAAAQAQAMLAGATQQSMASVAQQMSEFFTVVRAMVGSVMQSEFRLYSLKLRQTLPYSTYSGFLELFLRFERDVSPQ